jgi:hypothetical protein
MLLSTIFQLYHGGQFYWWKPQTFYSSDYFIRLYGFMVFNITGILLKVALNTINPYNLIK